MLAYLMRDGKHTVSQVSQDMRVSLAATSEYLRMLNARGLLCATRKGRRVSYQAEADRAVPHAAILLQAFKETLQVRPSRIDEAFADLTGFTHPRRIQIVRAITQGPISASALAHRIGISARSARRHLHKLHARGYVMRRGNHFDKADPKTPLARALIRLVTREE